MGCPRGGEGQCRPQGSAHPLCRPARAGSYWAGAGDLKGVGEELCTGPLGAQAGGLAGRRKPKLLELPWGNCCFPAMFPTQLPVFTRRREGELTQGPPVPSGACFTLQKRVARWRHFSCPQTVLSGEATQPVCPANARILGSSVLHMCPSGLWFRLPTLAACHILKQ